MWFSIKVIEDGIAIFVNEEHLLNAPFRIDVTKDKSIVFFFKEQPWKAKFPIVVIGEKIVIWINDEQQLNKWSLIDVIDDGCVIDFSEKLFLSILIIDEGNDMKVNEVNISKEDLPIIWQQEGIYKN